MHSSRFIGRYLYLLMLWGSFLVTVWVVVTIGGAAQNVIPDKLLPSSEYNLAGVIIPGSIAFLAGLAVALSLQRSVPYAVLIYLSAFVIRIAYMIFQAKFFLFDDEIALHWASASMTEREGWFPEFMQPGGYGWFVGLAYRLFGPNIFIPKFFNVVLGSLVPLLVYGLTWTVWKERIVARKIGVLAILAPPLVIYSPTHLKETMTLFLMLLGLWFVCRKGGEDSRRPMGQNPVEMLQPEAAPLRKESFNKISLSDWGLSILCFISLLSLRPFYAVPLLAAFFVIAFKGSLHKGRGRIRYVSAAIIVILVAGIFLSYRVYQDRFSDLFLDYFAGRIEATEGVSREFLDTQNPFSVRNLALIEVGLLFPIEPMVFLFDPDFVNLSQALIGIAWLGVLPLALLGMLRGLGPADKRVTAWAVMGLIGLVSLPASSWFGGIPTRHIIPFYPIFLLLSVNAFRSALTPKVILLWTTLYLFMVTGYLILKTAAFFA